MYKIEENTLTPNQFREICFAVGWIPPYPDQVAGGIDNSYCNFSVIDGDKVVAMGRLLGDRAMTFYVKDFAVLPEYQGKGVGRMLMTHMQSYIKQHVPKGWKVSLELLSTKGKEAFYQKFGFETRLSEYNGAGMFMMIDPR